jgi:hypothetical protein
MNAVFTGRKRSGKTTLAFDIAMRRGGGIIVYDPKREWRGWPGTVTEVEQIEEKLKNPDIDVIIYHPQGNKRKAFAPLAQLVNKLHQNAMAEHWDKQGKHFTFLVDEAVNVSTARWVDEDLLSLIAENRPEILDIYLTFQSPKDVNNLLKSRVDTWFVFNTSLPSDLEYLNKEVGVPEADLEEIAHLPEHEFAQFFFDGGTPKVEFINDSDEWFRPLEYFELNAEEREEISDMARDDRKRKEALEDLLEDLRDWKDRILDFFDDDGSGAPQRESREREREPRRREREPREKERSGGMRW